MKDITIIILCEKCKTQLGWCQMEYAPDGYLIFTCNTCHALEILKTKP